MNDVKRQLFDENLLGNSWKVTLTGAEGTLYDGEKFVLQVSFLDWMMGGWL